MATTGAEHLEAIKQDLTCPQCEYNLRGLLGEVVACPECGLSIDIVKLVANRWRKPWFRAPGYNRLSLPVVWLAITMIAAFAYWSFHAVGSVSVSMSIYWRLIGAVTVILAVWIWMMVKTARRFGGVRWFWLAMLLHPVVAFYVASTITVFSSAIFLLRSIVMTAQVLDIVAPLVTALIAVSVMVCCFFTERYVARQCIRRHLMLQTRNESDPTPTAPGSSKHDVQTR